MAAESAGTYSTVTLTPEKWSPWSEYKFFAPDECSLCELVDRSELFDLLFETVVPWTEVDLAITFSASMVLAAVAADSECKLFTDAEEVTELSWLLCGWTLISVNSP